MLTKSTIAASLIAAGFAFVAPAAEAKTNVYLGLGLAEPYPTYVYDDVPPPRRPRPHHWQPEYEYPDYAEDYGISCGEGRQIVRQSGFRRVRVIECDGQNFKYDASRRGRSFVVKVDSRDGSILDVRPF